jgi:hypothetical protein
MAVFALVPAQTMTSGNLSISRLIPRPADLVAESRAAANGAISFNLEHWQTFNAATRHC